MALDNNSGRRKPRTRQEEIDEQKRALEDRIVNDKDMASKIYQRAMETEAYSAEEARQRRLAEQGADEAEAETAAPSAAEASEAVGHAAEPAAPHREARTGVSAKETTGAASAGGTARKTAGLQPDGAAGRNGSPVKRPTAQNGSAHAAAPQEQTAQRRRQSAQQAQRSAANGQRAEGAEENAAAAARREAGTQSGGHRRRDEQAQQRRSVRQVNVPGDEEAELQRKRQDQKASQKNRKRNIILACVVELITLVLIFGFGTVVRYMNASWSLEFDRKEVENQNLDIEKKQAMEGYWTVAVFGVDSRDSSVGRGVNADVQIIANIDMGTGDVKLVSVYRDTYLNINKNNAYAKVNQAYADGGPERAVQTLNKNLDLDIQNYITFNWKAVADAITLLGGVEVEITDKEFYYMNAYIHETCVETGISGKNPAAHYIDGPGMQTLDGVQAVAYARLRKMDTDFRRTERQRDVIELALEKAKQADLATLLQIIDTVLPQIAFNIDTADIIQLAKGIKRYNIVETMGFPTKLDTAMMGAKGDCVIPVTLEKNVSALHAFLYGDTDYNPSDAVKRYSSKIADDYVKYTSGYYDADGKEKTTAEKTTEEETESTEETEKRPLVDEDGYLIKGTDENGEYIYETDADGKKVKPKQTTEAVETDRFGNTRPQLSTEEDETDEEDGDLPNLAPGETEETSRGDRPTVNPNVTRPSASEEAPVLPGETTRPQRPGTTDAEDEPTRPVVEPERPAESSRPSAVEPGGNEMPTPVPTPTPTTEAPRPTAPGPTEAPVEAPGGGPGSAGNSGGGNTGGPAAPDGGPGSDTGGPEVPVFPGM